MVFSTLSNQVMYPSEEMYTAVQPLLKLMGTDFILYKILTSGHCSEFEIFFKALLQRPEKLRLYITEDMQKETRQTKLRIHLMSVKSHHCMFL